MSEPSRSVFNSSRRAEDTALDQVLPRVPYRQWVFKRSPI